MKFGRRASSFLESHGPETMDDLATWDSTYLAALKGTKEGRVLHDNLQRSLLVATDFSGFDAPRECCRLMSEALAREWNESVPVVRFVRSCDWGNLQQQVLMLESQVYDDGGACVFGNILDRLTEDQKLWIEAASPSKEMSLEDAQAANSLIQSFMAQNRDQFSVDAESYCFMHRRKCPVHVKQVLKNMTPASSSARVAGCSSAQQSAESAGEPSRRRGSAHSYVPWYEKELQELLPSQNPGDAIVCSVSGLVCTDFTPLGKRKGASGGGVTDPCHTVWTEERLFQGKKCLEDWYFSENSGSYPVLSKQVAALEDSHQVMHIHICPTQLGFPMKRSRMFSFGLNKSKWVWVGAPADEVQAHFESFFGARCELAGDVYLQAEHEEVLAFAEEIASKRRRTLPANYRDVPTQQYMTCLVPPGAMARLATYEKVRAERQSLTGEFMCDLDHNLDCGPSCGPEMPPLDTHPKIYSFKAGRLLLGKELLAAQGVDMYPGLAGQRGISPLAQIFENFRDQDLRFLAGNAIHIPAFAAWILFCAGNVVSRETYSKLPMPMKEPPPIEDTAGSADAEFENDLMKKVRADFAATAAGTLQSHGKRARLRL